MNKYTGEYVSTQNPPYEDIIKAPIKVKVKTMVRLKNGNKISKQRYDQLKHVYETNPLTRWLAVWFLKVESDPGMMERFKNIISKDPEPFLYKHPDLNNKGE